MSMLVVAHLKWAFSFLSMVAHVMVFAPVYRGSIIEGGNMLFIVAQFGHEKMVKMLWRGSPIM